MKNYNLKNYKKHKADLNFYRDKLVLSDFEQIMMDRDSMIYRYSYLCEKIARTFPLTEQSSGILSFEDLVSEGYIGLIAGVDNVDVDLVMSSEFPERSLIAFLSKRIDGSMKRAINNFRGAMRLSEYKIRQIRKNKDKDKKLASLFFNCIFESIDSNSFDKNKLTVDINGNAQEYDVNFMSAYLIGVINKTLTKDEADVIIYSYGLDLDAEKSKLKIYEIADRLSLDGKSMYRDINSIKYSALEKLTSQVDMELIVNFLNN